MKKYIHIFNVVCLCLAFVALLTMFFSKAAFHSTYGDPNWIFPKIDAQESVFELKVQAKDIVSRLNSMQDMFGTAINGMILLNIFFLIAFWLNVFRGKKIGKASQEHEQIDPTQ